MSGEPIVGLEQTALARIIGDFSSLSFDLVDENGAMIQELSSFGPGTSPAPMDAFLGSFIVPSLPFRVSVSGELSSGQTFTRSFATLFRPQTLSIDLDYEFIIYNGGGLILKGQTSIVKYIVKNMSPETRDVALTAVDEFGLLSVDAIIPSVLTLNSFETGIVDVELSPRPCSGAELLPDSLTVTASSGTSSNSKSVILHLSCNQAPSCGSPKQKILWPPNNKIHDIDVEAEADISDPDGDELVLRVTSIFQNEPVGKKPDGLGIGDSIASVRAKREGGGKGRVYRIDFSVDDLNGGSCDGTLCVIVPRDRRGEFSLPESIPFDSTQANEKNTEPSKKNGNSEKESSGSSKKKGKSEKKEKDRLLRGPTQAHDPSDMRSPPA